MGRADWIPNELMNHILAALTPQNALAIKISLATGLRIDDVLNLRTADIKKGKRFTVTERKTHKRRRVYLPADLQDQLLQQAGRYFAFEGRCSELKPRTRQAVNKDIARAAAAFRVPKAIQISPHSARKIYAVKCFDKYGDPKKVQELLNHSNESVTLLYCMAEQIYQKKAKKGQKRKK